MGKPVVEAMHCIYRGDYTRLCGNYRLFLRDYRLFLRDYRPFLRDYRPFLRDYRPFVRDYRLFLRDYRLFLRDVAPVPQGKPCEQRVVDVPAGRTSRASASLRISSQYTTTS
jgi:hypothetical protein